MEPRKRLGEILLEMKLVTPGKIENALEHARRTSCRLGEALVPACGLATVSNRPPGSATG